MAHLNNHVATMEYEKLFAGLNPPYKVASGTIEKLSAAATYKRGTVLALSSTSNKLKILGTAASGNETLIADCILCDDVEIGSTEDVNVAVYVIGNFNKDALIVKEGYTLTDADVTNLRQRGIYLGTVQALY